MKSAGWKMCPLMIFVLATYIHEGLSIKCWMCNSAFDPACGDPFDNTTIAINDCDSNPELPQLPGVKSTMCRKIRQQVDGELRIIRGCAYLGEPGIAGNEQLCLTPTSSYKISMEYCTCNNKDACNTGSQVYSNQFAVLVVGILTCLMGSFI